MFEEQVIIHCAPTLAGIKMAGLFNYYYTSKQQFILEMKKCADKLKEKGVYIAILRETPEAALIYVYRRSMFYKVLKSPEISGFLRQHMYPEVSGMDVCWQSVNELRRRFRLYEGFPHEIGVFLGYPLEDVIGFIENEGKNYKCIGCWKVYCDENAAQCLFCKYKKCRDVYHRLFQSGRSLKQLTVTM